MREIAYICNAYLDRKLNQGAGGPPMHGRSLCFVCLLAFGVFVLVLGMQILLFSHGVSSIMLVDCLEFCQVLRLQPVSCCCPQV